MIPESQKAAHLLLGETLQDGWKVIEKLEPSKDETGGVYSCCYRVENEGRIGFLKAFDYSGAEKVSNKSKPDRMLDILKAYKLEREILDKCTQYNCKNIISLIGHGSHEIKSVTRPDVEYLILEYAENPKMKDMLDKNDKSIRWKLESLHQIAKGLNQIHQLSIAHQDIKPSNTVDIKEGRIKITDFGSAMPININEDELPPHLFEDIPGTWSYSPPELLYGYLDPNPIVRRIGCDLYMFGSMIVYYFTNMNMTSLIKMNLDDNLCWTNSNNRHQFEQLKPYIIAAYEQALVDIEILHLKNPQIAQTLIPIIRYLCHPDPNNRGHEKTIIQVGDNYKLERIISMLSLLIRQVKTGRIK